MVYSLLARVLRREVVSTGCSSAASLEAASEEAASEEAASEEAASLDAASEEAASLDAASEEAASLEAASEEAASLEAASEEAASEEAASLEAASLEAASTKASDEAYSGTGWASGSASACTAVLAASKDASAKAAVGSTLNATADASASAVMRCVTLRILSLLFFNFKFSAYTQIFSQRAGLPQLANQGSAAGQARAKGQPAAPQSAGEKAAGIKPERLLYQCRRTPVRQFWQLG